MQTENSINHAQQGSILISAPGKTRITIYLDDDVLAVFRGWASHEGRGYQTLINEALRAAIAPEAVPVTTEALRQVLREELLGLVRSSCNTRFIDQKGRLGNHDCCEIGNVTV